MIAGRGGDQRDPVANAPGTELISHQVDATTYFECADWLKVLELRVVVAAQFFRNSSNSN